MSTASSPISSPPEAAVAAFETLPAIPRGAQGPVFREPWEAEVFALALRLHERGAFSWGEWAAALAEEIRAAGSGDTGADYYRHWLTALEKLTARRGLVSGDELVRRHDAWERAARATPHGQPIEFDRESGAKAIKP